jgi:hypothetical protein
VWAPAYVWGQDSAKPGPSAAQAAAGVVGAAEAQDASEEPRPEAAAWASEAARREVAAP